MIYGLGGLASSWRSPTISRAYFVWVSYRGEQHPSSVLVMVNWQVPDGCGGCLHTDHAKMVRRRASCVGVDASNQGCPRQKNCWRPDKGSHKPYKHSQHPLACAHAHPDPERTQDRSVTFICVPQVHQDTEPSSKDEADPMGVQCLLHSCQSL